MPVHCVYSTPPSAAAKQSLATIARLGFISGYMQTLTTTDFLTIVYRPDLRFLVARWQRPVSGAETRDGYQQILAAAMQCQCPYWLLDGRRRTPADEQTTNWGLQEFFPSLSTRLGQTVYMSQLLSPSYQMLTMALPVFAEAEANLDNTYQMRRFNDETRAVEWLQWAQQQNPR